MNISHYPVDSNTAILVADYCNSHNVCNPPKPHMVNSSIN